MRVIAGTFRSRILKEVGEHSTRETKDLVKESMFNSIGPSIVERKVLDLFAGSGSLGIESLSRGAKTCVFIDSNIKAISTIRENVVKLDLMNLSGIVQGEYFKYLNSTSSKFDVILLDPPYSMDVINSIIELISFKKLLSENGVIISLTEKNTVLKEKNNDIIKYKEKTKGITKISFWKWG